MPEELLLETCFAKVRGSWQERLYGTAIKVAKGANSLKVLGRDDVVEETGPEVAMSFLRRRRLEGWCDELHKAEGLFHENMAAQDGFARFNLAPELLAAPGCEVIVRNLPEILEVAVQDEPVGTLPAQKQLEKPKRLLIVEGCPEIVGDDRELISGLFGSGTRHYHSMEAGMKKARRDGFPERT